MAVLEQVVPVCGYEAKRRLKKSTFNSCKVIGVGAKSLLSFHCTPSFVCVD
jgi:hypothetical protein